MWTSPRNIRNHGLWPIAKWLSMLWRSTCLSLNGETSPTTNDMGISSRNVLLNGESSVGTLLKMMSLGWALSSPHWRLEMEWFTQPKLDLATGQKKTTWGWSSGGLMFGSWGTCLQPNPFLNQRTLQEGRGMILQNGPRNIEKCGKHQERKDMNWIWPMRIHARLLRSG